MSGTRERITGKSSVNLPINMTMLKALTELSETGSFSKAAERLCLTQSAVSHAVRALEESAGVPLVSRSGRTIVLTAAGERAAGHARSALEEVRQIASLSENPVAGEVTLALITSASIKLAPSLLQEVAKRYPGLKISLLMGTDQEVARWVRDGIADLGITFDRGECESNPILNSEFVAISGVKSGVPDGPVSLDCLSRQPFIMSSGGCAPIIDGLFGEAGLTPKIALTANDTTALFALVAAGHGVSVVPALSFPSAGEYAVKRHALEPQVRLPLWLAERTGAAGNAECDAVKSVLNAVTRRVASDNRMPGIYLE